jgi:trans-AT polyketide synthase/acyltransferase/oxidoreductase domain-containing protein
LSLSVLGRHVPGSPARFDAEGLVEASHRAREPVHVVRHPAGHVGVAFGGQPEPEPPRADETAWLGTLPALFPEWLGERSFGETHGTRFSYIAGAMANGIGSPAIVIAMAQLGALGFFGAAGLGLHRVEAGIDEIQRAVGPRPYGVNLIHSPQEPLLERGNVELLLKKDVRRVSASAYMALTAPLVRYACSGLREVNGRIERRNHVFAKISRPETARRFLSPAPRDLLEALVRDGLLTADEARLALRVPVAEDVTVESDSGGHTDNQPLGAVFPVIAALRDALCAEHGYERPVRVGAAGGLGTPQAVAAAYAMGAAYVLTGSVNQSSVEAALSPRAKEMLCKADVADVTMAPAADMFELGVEVQVLRRGTMFAARASRLRDLYARYDAFERIPAEDRARLEREIFCAPVDRVWQDTRAFWAQRDPRQAERGDTDPKHRLALLFRWYLGKASRWAIDGDPARVADYQIWCGPAQGSFNQWVKGSFLEPAANRTVSQIARNLLEGAAVVTRAQQLRAYGVAVPRAAFQFAPRPLA